MYVNGAITSQEKCSRMARPSSLWKLGPPQQRRHGPYFTGPVLPSPPPQATDHHAFMLPMSSPHGMPSAGYVIMIAGANEISQSSVGLVYFCAIFPTLLVKLTGPYW